MFLSKASIVVFFGYCPGSGDLCLCMLESSSHFSHKKCNSNKRKMIIINIHRRTHSLWIRSWLIHYFFPRFYLPISLLIRNHLLLSVTPTPFVASTHFTHTHTIILQRNNNFCFNIAIALFYFVFLFHCFPLNV